MKKPRASPGLGLKRDPKTNEYKCDTCDKVFKHASGLKTHDDTVHQGIRKYVCDLCGKAYKKSSGMYSHPNI